MMMAHQAAPVVLNGNGGGGLADARPQTPTVPLSIDEVKKRHGTLCAELNMDTTATQDSWRNFQTIAQNHTLEGDQMHWLCCSLYIACRSGHVPTVAGPDRVVQGNCVSMTHLLRACNITCLEFFHKMERWLDMVDSPQIFRARIERLKQNLIVSLLVYDNYQMIFKDLFVGLQVDETRKRKKTVAMTPCSSRKLYEFCWYLFLCAKSEMSERPTDLVTTFNILLCCIDLVFANIVADKRVDLVNPRLCTDPEWNTEELLQAAEAAASADAAGQRKRICTIGLLCKLYEGPSIDAIETKHGIWKRVLDKYMTLKVLRGDTVEQLDLLTVENFDMNLTALKNVYKSYFLSVGDIDEGILLTQMENCTSSQAANSLPPAIRMSPRPSADGADGVAFRTRVLPFAPAMRRFLAPSREGHLMEPMAMVTRSVQRLRAALGAYNAVVPPSLMELLRLSPNDPLPKIKSILGHLSALFCERFEANARERFELAEMLYYRLLENILRHEHATRAKFDYKVLHHEVFHTTLITCSVEIVIHAYMSRKQFPWVLQCFSVEAYHFYKIIEMIVLNQGDMLTRDVIKHLNTIEEQCLDSLVWRSSSPLWDLINQCDQLPERADADTPKEPPAVKELPHMAAVTNGAPRSAMERLLQSPIDVTERFNSETPNGHQAGGGPRPDGPHVGNAENVAKQLFKTTPVPNAAGATGARSATLGSSSLGSMKLFFRKFYKLAYLRMIEICRHLNYLNDAYLQKIWTIFEYSITKESELMRDRHLDQILMCAIYVFGRNGRFPTTFKDIMLSYRKQPLTTSNVYRDVHMTEADIAYERETPGQGAAATAAANAGAEKKYDIISFYNFCYVRSMQEFVMSTREDRMLSPLPSYGNPTMTSPRKVSERHSLYIQPYEPRELPLSPNTMTYSFKASPVESYGRVLNLPNMRNSNGKRVLPFDGSENNGAGIYKMSRLVSVVNNGAESSAVANGGNASQAPSGAPERVPYIREKLQKIITDRQGNN